jgi:hypothetical protein
MPRQFGVIQPVLLAPPVTEQPGSIPRYRFYRRSRLALVVGFRRRSARRSMLHASGAGSPEMG